ncbi:ArsR/SmtB family transcription factor [Pseudomonas chlororaphis]
MLDTDQKSTSTSPHFDATMRAIAHPVRRKILEWLKAPTLHFPPQPCGFEFGVSVGQITQRCGLPQSTVSQHLAVLKGVALVDVHKTGPFHFLKRNEAAIQHLTGCLSDLLENRRLPAIQVEGRSSAQIILITVRPHLSTRRRQSI